MWSCLDIVHHGPKGHKKSQNNYSLPKSQISKHQSKTAFSLQIDDALPWEKFVFKILLENPKIIENNS